MRAAIFIGSPRANGNTATLASMLNTSLEAKGVECRSFHLYKHKIKPCLDCRICKAEEMECAQTDGMALLYENLEWADVIVFGTPIYWFGPSAQTKLMIDRFRPYFANKKLYGKRGALLLPAGSGSDDCDLTIEQFKRVFKALGIEYIDSITIKAYDKDDARFDASTKEFVDDLVLRIVQEEKV